MNWKSIGKGMKKERSSRTKKVNREARMTFLGGGKLYIGERRFVRPFQGWRLTCLGVFSSRCRPGVEDPQSLDCEGRKKVDSAAWVGIPEVEFALRRKKRNWRGGGGCRSEGRGAHFMVKRSQSTEEAGGGGSEVGLRGGTLVSYTGCFTLVLCKYGSNHLLMK